MAEAGSHTEVTKASIRESIWSYLENNNIARFPRPVYNRIPNFQDAEQACEKVQLLEEYKNAKVLVVTPDSPLKHIRFLALQDQKTLLVPTPALKKGLLNIIQPPLGANKKMLHECSTNKGVKNHSRRLPLNSKIKVDVAILGSVAVSLKGQRIGKGEGYADLEVAMMSTMGNVTQDTTVISIVHDCQVLDSIPDDLFGEHDVPVDIIATPTRVILCEPRLPRPSCIIWSLLTEKRLRDIPILNEVRVFEEGKG